MPRPIFMPTADGASPFAACYSDALLHARPALRASHRESAEPAQPLHRPGLKVPLADVAMSGSRSICGRLGIGTGRSQSSQLIIGVWHGPHSDRRQPSEGLWSIWPLTAERLEGATREARLVVESALIDVGSCGGLRPVLRVRDSAVAAGVCTTRAGRSRVNRPRRAIV
jgi:hypothetical protein